MIHSIQSGTLYIDIDDQGAELKSLYSKKTNTEYLWQGNAAIWERQAPVLFPIVGRLKNNQYTYGDKTYEMPPHGFVFDAPFSAEVIGENGIAFIYEDTKETRAIYPFSFTLQVIFVVNWNKLEVVYQVINRTNGPMYFSFGSHEGYCCPRADGEAFSDYYLEFDHDADYTSLTVSPDGLLIKEPIQITQNERRLPLSYDLFDDSSLVFADIPSGKVVLGSTKTPAKIEINYESAPNLVVWSQTDAPYVCKEPWHGLPDFEDASGDLTKKPGIIQIEKGGTYNWRHTITVYE